MSTPTQRHTRASRKRRASHFSLNGTGLHDCPKCKSAKMPHRVCENCGFYKGRQVVVTKS